MSMVSVPNLPTFCTKRGVAQYEESLYIKLPAVRATSTCLFPNLVRDLSFREQTPCFVLPSCHMVRPCSMVCKHLPGWQLIKVGM